MSDHTYNSCLNCGVGSSQELSLARIAKAGWHRLPLWATCVPAAQEAFSEGALHTGTPSAGDGDHGFIHQRAASHWE